MLIFWPSGLPVVIIPIVVMPSVALDASVCHSHVQWPLQTERHETVARDPYSPASNLSAVDRPHNCAHKAVIALRFDSLRIRPYRILVGAHKGITDRLPKDIPSTSNGAEKFETAPLEPLSTLL